MTGLESQYKELANAIITQAADDYINNPDKPGVNRREITMFFRSDWFNQLSDLDGEKIIAILKERVKERESLDLIRKI